MTYAVSVDPHDLFPAGPPLGELLLSRGLITPEQLEQALADQRESGRPLGETFIRLGFTSGPIIAQALATQHGRLLKSEYGFATGFDAVFSKPDAPPAPQAASASPATEQPARADLKIVDAAEQNAAPAARPDEEHGIADYIGRLELQLTEAKAAIEASRLAHESEASQLREALRQRDEVGERKADASHHLVFFPAVGRGYVLLERPGPAPAVGDVVDTSADGGSAVTYVTKVAQPPVPGPRLRCAYLL